MPGIDFYSLGNHGLDGVSALKRKTGTASSPSQSLNFQRFGYADGAAMSCRYIEVPEADFGFEPKIIITTYPGSPLSGNLQSYMQSIYLSRVKDAYGHALIGHGDSTGNRYDLATGGGLNGYVNPTGFRIPVLANLSSTSLTLHWEALGWDD
ncbi:hypothetical protein ACINKY_21290 [Paenibacillus illinoisensis]|uniref:Uncharacterized protein n=1 Tax=Paenibacillus illinoisensis TaxID=59845 RepID=A0ABW8HZQ9_9BACL